MHQSYGPPGQYAGDEELQRGKSPNGLPLLQDILMLGSLFRITQDQAARTELLMPITTHLLESLEKARSVTTKLRRKLPTTEPPFERAR
ncbi:MAG: hypothetical protein ACLQJR_33595 [Stellaceae bacterium]